MHKHEDYPQLDPSQQHYLLSGGLDKIWVKAEPLGREAGEIPQPKIQEPIKVGAVL